MQAIVRFFNSAQNLLDGTRSVDFIAPLLLRLYLAPVFWMAGAHKLADMPSTIEWFGNAEWGLGLPLPALMAWLAALTEMLGAVLLVAGLAVRWISVPLMITMVIAAISVHWQNGWLAIASADGLFATDRTAAAVERLERARELLQQHGNYEWLIEHGGYVVLNNGIEFAATYFVMLLALFFIGAGRFVSLDHYIARALRRS